MRCQILLPRAVWIFALVSGVQSEMSDRAGRIQWLLPCLSVARSLAHCLLRPSQATTKIAVEKSRGALAVHDRVRAVTAILGKSPEVPCAHRHWEMSRRPFGLDRVQVV